MKGTPITPDVFDYIVETFAPEDTLLKEMPADAEKRGIPLINIDPIQGKFLQVLMRACNATRVLEVGSLFGYSAIWMARALPPQGRLYALEINAAYAETIRGNVARAGLADKITVIEGDARATLPSLAAHAPFDFAFVDAEKMQYVDYFDHLMALLRPGAILVADNASAGGDVWKKDDKSSFVTGIRAMNQRMATDPRLTSLLVPVGDGMCVAVVR